MSCNNNDTDNCGCSHQHSAKCSFYYGSALECIDVVYGDDLQTVIENTIEYAIFNQYKNLTLSLVFSINPLNIEVRISLSHNPHIIKRVKYTPEYRECILQWQDQIRLLNTLNNYNIEKKVTFIKTKTHLSGSNIILKIPNLA